MRSNTSAVRGRRRKPRSWSKVRPEQPCQPICSAIVSIIASLKSGPPGPKPAGQLVAVHERDLVAVDQPGLKRRPEDDHGAGPDVTFAAARISSCSDAASARSADASLGRL